MNSMSGCVGICDVWRVCKTSDMKKYIFCCNICNDYADT